MKKSPIKCYDDIPERKLHLINKFRPEDETKNLGGKVIRLKDWSSQTPNKSSIQNTKRKKDSTFIVF